MRKNLLHGLFILQFLFISIIAQAQLQKIYLQPKAAGSSKQAQFVDSIRFIPLEVKDGIESGAYNYVQVTDKYFMITNYFDKSIFFYSKNGAFVKKINYKKFGDSFSPIYDKSTNQVIFLGDNKNYTLTPKDRLKITLDWSNPHNKKYKKKYTIDLGDTSFTIKKSIPSENDIIGAGRFYDDFYFQQKIITSPLFKDSTDYELKIYKNNQLVKAFFPYNHINEPKFLYGNEEAVFLNKTDTPYVHFVTRPYCDTIYRMTRNNISAAYQLVLPLENSLPSSFFSKPFRNKTERDNFFRNNGWMLGQVHQFYETPTLIFFSVGYLSNYELYICQKRTGITFRTKNIKPDSSQYNLPLLADFSVVREGDRFYKTKKAGDILPFFEQNKNVPVPKELEAFLKSNPPATTPVIVEFKLKN